MANLFNKKILDEQIHQYEIENFQEKFKVIKDWKRNLKSIKGVNEKGLQGSFLKGIFGNVLDYKDITEANLEGGYTLKSEPSTEVDATNPDGALGVFNTSKNSKDNTIAVIELKSPKASLDKKQKRSGKDYGTPIEQAFRYATKHDGCKWVIVSNMIEIRLYKYERGQGHYQEFLIDELDKKENFYEFHFLLSKENLINPENSNEGMTLKLSKRTVKHEEDISINFYNIYKNMRIELFEHLKNNNPNYNEEILLEKAQKFLDRIIFICFCEDRSLLPNDILHRIITKNKEMITFSDTPIWDGIRGLFKMVDKGSNKHNINGYNGNLFKPDEVLDELIIQDEFFDKIYNISNYDFSSDLDVNILGHIFEQSINDIEEIKSEIKDNEYDEKESKRKKDGIFYTPEYITKYIVENSIGGYLDNLKKELGYYELPDIDSGKTPQVKGKYRNKHLDFYDRYEERLKNIKVLDPACGSGAFLNQAFDYLLKEHQWLHKQKELINKGRRTIFGLSSLQKQILKNNIYGVDLNEESVEITKLSLWLKTANKNKKLVSLDDNIKCGNSLISDPQIGGNKSFVWHKEFEEIINNGGFDVVVGNPPYVFARNNSFDEEEKEYYYNNYDLTSYQLNTFVLFMEKGIKLLKETGWFGYIIPNNWLTINSFKSLRKYILTNMKEIKIINTHDEVFNDASVDSCINIWSKSGEDTVSVGEYKNEFTELTEVSPKFFLDDEDHIINISMAKKRNIKDILNKIDNSSSPLSEVVEEVVSGLQAYEVGKGKPPQTESMRDNRIYHSKDKKDDNYFPYVHGRDVKRYFLAESESFLKYGEHLAAPREFYKFSDPRILVRQIPDTPPYCIHSIFTDGTILNDRNSNNILGFGEVNPLFVLGMLNSRLVSFWFEYTFDKFQRDIYPQFKVNELERFPINIKASDNNKINIINNVKKIISNKRKLKQLGDINFNEICSKYSSKNGLSLEKIIESSNFKNKLYSGRARKIRNYTININSNIITIYLDKSSSGKYEVIKFEESDRYKRKFVKYYLENLSDEKIIKIDENFEGNILNKTLEVKIPDYNKTHVVKKIVREWENLQKQKKELKEITSKLDKEIDQIIYEIYHLTNEEIEIIEEK
ncbi:MAG: Eco57I restriction endonuclease [Halanaerobium sp. T82-1]|jgi:tRNA1(Val) A37 N6-methylase TrmN6|nr:MAG: Eco57I restriction endonuclease [Halanaerobium sp. T82-1]